MEIKFHLETHSYISYNTVQVKYNEIDVDEAKEVDRYMNEQKSFVFDFMKEEKLREDNAVDNMVLLLHF